MKDGGMIMEPDETLFVDNGHRHAVTVAVSSGLLLTHHLPSLHRSARRYEGTISAVGRRSLPFTHPVQTGGPGRSPPFGAHGGRDENGERRTTRGKERTNSPSHFILRLAVPFSAPFPPRSSRPFTTPFGFRSGDE